MGKEKVIQSSLIPLQTQKRCADPVNQTLTKANGFCIYKLVQKFYQPGSPQEVARIQDILQKLQRSQQGWQFADALLRSQDEKLRFFGALTFTIKINQDWQGFSALKIAGTNAYPLTGTL